MKFKKAKQDSLRFISLINILAKYFVKGTFGVGFSLVFPILTMFILGFVLNRNLVFPGILTIASSGICLVLMPSAMLDIKNSILLKRIATTPINTRVFVLSIVIFYIAVSVICTLFIWLFGYLFFAFNDNGKPYNYFSDIVKYMRF